MLLSGSVFSYRLFGARTLITLILRVKTRFYIQLGLRHRVNDKVVLKGLYLMLNIIGCNPCRHDTADIAAANQVMPAAAFGSKFLSPLFEQLRERHIGKRRGQTTAGTHLIDDGIDIGRLRTRRSV